MHLSINVRGENPTSWTGIKPSPSNIGDKLTWPRVHVTPDPLSYRLRSTSRTTFSVTKSSEQRGATCLEQEKARPHYNLC